MSPAEHGYTKFFKINVILQEEEKRRFPYRTKVVNNLNTWSTSVEAATLISRGFIACKNLEGESDDKLKHLVGRMSQTK